MAPTFRAATVAATTLSNSASVSLTLSKPVGTVQNDFLFACIQVYSSNNVITWTKPSASWVLLDTIGTLYIWRLRAGGSEPSTYTWSGTASSGIYDAAGGLVGYSGVPVPVSTPQALTGSGASTTPTIPPSPVATTAANDIFITVYGVLNSAGGSAPTVSAASGWTSRVNEKSAGTGVGATVLIQEKVAALTGGGSSSATSNFWSGVTIFVPHLAYTAGDEFLNFQ